MMQGLINRMFRHSFPPVADSSEAYGSMEPRLLKRHGMREQTLRLPASRRLGPGMSGRANLREASADLS